MANHRITPLQGGKIYHIFNRGNNRENIFREERNYLYFLTLYAKYIDPIASTLAFCLLANHFHLLVWIRENAIDRPYQAFANLFGSYTKAMNKTYGRTGSLFEKPFQRILVTDEDYLRRLIVYIHRNPEHHGFVDDFRNWPYSSYQMILDNNRVVDWFEGIDGFLKSHELPQGMTFL